MLAIHHHRAPLSRLALALASGTVRLGFLGGSITDQKTGRRWPEPFIAWMINRWPNVRFIIENAAIGATGSDLASVRARRDIIKRDCDLVFVEYAVNDHQTPPLRRARAREGLLRQLLSSGRSDVLLVHTFCAEFHSAFQNETAPESIADFERLAEHYGISSVWFGLAAWRELHTGLLRWEEWLPDGLHPDHRGSHVYALSVIEHVRTSLDNPVPPVTLKSLPEPLESECWQHPCALKFEKLDRTGPWSERRWGQLNWIDQVLQTTAPGATLKGRFHGHTFLAVFDFGRASAEFRWRIDHGPWLTSTRPRPSWVGETGWLRPSLLAEELADCEHTFELETLLGADPDGRGLATTLAWLVSFSR